MRMHFIDTSYTDGEYKYKNLEKGITEITNLKTNVKGIVYYQGTGFVIKIGDKTHYDDETWKNWL